MTIIIDISEDMHQAVESGMWCGNDLWFNALKNGIPLTTWIELWLKGFNTDSATDCFNAVQQLKKEIE